MTLLWPAALTILLATSPIVEDCAGGTVWAKTCYNICQLRLKDKTIHYAKHLTEEAGERHVCACYTERVVVSFREGENQKAYAPEKDQMEKDQTK